MWFLAQTKPNGLGLAREHLARQGILTFTPSEHYTTQYRGKFVSKTRPLFPGYIFVSPSNTQSLSAINATRGISRVVTFGTTPARIPEELVIQLKARCDETGTLLPFKKLNPGDEIRVIRGPFAELVGSIDKIEPERRVWAIFEILGTQIRVNLNSDDLSCM